MIVGKDPRGVKGLWKRMLDAVFKGGNEGVASDAISAIDVALWDLKAKANDEPLWKTLGASTRYVRAYASGIDMPLSDEELAEFYEGMAAKGVSAGKLKVGVDRETDLRRIGIMQDALKTSGKTPQLMVDSNEYWSPKQAIRNIRAFEERFELLWCEEPARRWDYRGLRKVSRSVTAAVATGENLSDIKDFMPLIANEAGGRRPDRHRYHGHHRPHEGGRPGLRLRAAGVDDELPGELYGARSCGHSEPHDDGGRRRT